ncbi:MAG: hypothetical protein HY699_04655 [Deltaproteobacteria bacterium]|nr:hypothetical protein [Deltaproteobacteria bacterium]
MDDPAISISQSLVRALWLVDNHLVDCATPSPREHDPRTVEAAWRLALRIRLEALGLRDDVTIDQAVSRFLRFTPSLLANVNRLCEALFERHHGLPVMCSEPLCRRVARVIDPDVLVCLYPGLALPPDERFDWAAVPLRHNSRTVQLLRDASVDTHIHLGGALPPLYYWLALMGGEVSLDTLVVLPSARRQTAPFPEWRLAVMDAIWLRLQLARRLQAMQGPASGQRLFPHLPPAEQWKLPDKTPDSPAAVRDTALRLSAPSRRFAQQFDHRGPFSDPLRTHRAPHARVHYAEGERRLLYHLGSYLRLQPSTGPQKSAQAEVADELLRYLRVRNAFHSLLVHDNGTDGLFRFREPMQRRGFVNGRRRSGRSARSRRRFRRFMFRIERNRMATALDAALLSHFDGTGLGPHRPHRRIEMRVSVTKGTALLPTIHAWLKGFADHLQPGWDRRPSLFAIPAVPRTTISRSQLGLVFHAHKSGDERKGRADAATLARADANRLWGVLKDYPHLRRFITGFDAAGRERLTPPRDFGAAFGHLLERQCAHRARPGEEPVRLGWTFHVGEDLSDFLTGLRHVDEAATLLVRGAGRLGHALVLGDDPQRFYDRRRGETEPSIGTHLLDLVWAWGRLMDAGCGDQCPWLEERILRLVQERRRTQGEKGASPNIGGCFRSMGLTAPAMRVASEAKLLAELTFAGDARESIPIRPEPHWIDLLRRLQALLQERLARFELCVEVCPTSNVLVAGFDAYEQLPYRSLVDAGLAVSINTDNPGLFMTSLPAEFAALHQVLIGSMSHRRALEWLAARRFDADQSTFVGHHVPTGENALAAIARM